MASANPTLQPDYTANPPTNEQSTADPPLAGQTLLLPHHAQMLQKSAIQPEVIAARGYRSVRTKAELKQLGFADSQVSVPTLLVPIWGVGDEVVLYHHRPDTPRVRQGKVVKYEFPSGSRMAIDVHPFIKDKVRDPSIPLFITEGVKKADAGVSLGLCCIGLIGTWNWRGTNEYGGKTALPDWHSIALKHGDNQPRDVYICYDSDVMIKPQVYQALVEVSRFLRSKGANVLFIYLPSGEGGTKVGLDDYIAQERGVDDLLALATPELRKPETAGEGRTSTGASAKRLYGPYQETDSGLFLVRPTQHGPVEQQLTNFTARITGEVIEDDGTETALTLEIEARLGSRATRFTLPAQQLGSLNWPIEQLGASAIVYPGLNTKDHVRAAIQIASSEAGIARRRAYTCTGWHRDPNTGVSVYQHGKGIIGPSQSSSEAADGDHQEPGVDNPWSPGEARFSSILSGYELPPPPEGQSLVEAILAVLRLLKLGPRHLMTPLICSAHRAVLGDSDFSVWLTGHTGVFKSELAALAQQHFGPSMTARNLPGNWSSSGNALEASAFYAKDALFVIDDFVPAGGQRVANELHWKAERVLRAQGNHTGRGRMRQDGSLRPPKPPRGLILGTGEDVPSGGSLRGRMLILEVSQGDIPSDLLAQCQQDGVEGLYAASMAGFIQWLSGDYEQTRAKWQELALQLRHRAAMQAHARTPDIIASLAATWPYMLSFWVEAGAVTYAEAEQLHTWGWQALLEAGRGQSEHQHSQEPATRFIELLTAASGSGMAHVTDLQGGQPEARPEAWGWKLHEVGTGDHTRLEWRPQGIQVGWVDEGKDDLYLLPEPAYKVAQRLGESTGAALATTQQTLLKRLKQQGYLKSVEHARQTNTVRRRLSSAQHNVVHLSVATILGEEPDNCDIPDFDQLLSSSVTHAKACGVSSSLSGSPAANPDLDNEYMLEPTIASMTPQVGGENDGFVSFVEHQIRSFQDRTMEAISGSPLGSDPSPNDQDQGHWVDIPSGEPVQGGGRYRWNSKTGRYQQWLQAGSADLEPEAMPRPDDPTSAIINDALSNPSE